MCCLFNALLFFFNRKTYTSRSGDGEAVSLDVIHFSSFSRSASQSVSSTRVRVRVVRACVRACHRRGYFIGATRTPRGPEGAWSLFTRSLFVHEAYRALFRARWQTTIDDACAVAVYGCRLPGRRVCQLFSKAGRNGGKEWIMMTVHFVPVT